MPNEKEQEDLELEDLFRDEEAEGAESIEREDRMKEIAKKEEGMKKLKEIGVKAFWIIVFVALAIYIFGYSSFNKKSESKDVPSEKEVKEVSLKEDLVKKYNVVIFDDQEFSFSKDVQERIGDNFLLEGDVYDIFKRDDKTFVKIDGYDYFGVFAITEEQEKYIREQKNEYGSISNLFVVVELNNISKSLFDAEGERDGENIWVYREPSDDFLLKGRLLDVKSLNNY